MSAKKTNVTPKPYPYNIDIEVPGIETIRKLDPWSILEFLRREALLRSERVQELYRKRSEQILWREYGLKWRDLWQRELWLDLQFPMFQGMWNLKQELLDDPEILEILVKQLLEEEDSRFLVVSIDTAVPPQRIMKSLKHHLVYRHKRVLKTIQEPRLTFADDHRCIPPYHPRKRPPIGNFLTWAKYLDCYDLRIEKALSFGKIAKRVYPPGGPKARDLAEKAVVRVERLIRAAEQNVWPPKL